MGAKIVPGLALALLASASHAYVVKICGSIVMPDGVSLATGDIQAQVSVMKVMPTTYRTLTANASVDGTARTFCVDGNNNLEPEGYLYHTARLKIAKTSSSPQEIHTGQLIVNFPDGSSGPVLAAGTDYYALVDAFYLGPNDPLPSKLSFPGFNAYTSESAASGGYSVISPNMAGNRVISETFDNGNLVANGSFENGYSSWDPVFTVPNLLSLKAKSGVRTAAVMVPSTTSNAMISASFPVKPNTQYTVSYWYRGYQVSGDARGLFRSYAEKPNEGSTVDQSVTMDAAYVNTGYWTRVAKTLTTSSTARFATITLVAHSGSSSGGGLFAFDQVMVEPVTSSISGKVMTKLSYFDGFNRSLQEVQPFGNLDIISATEYDGFGRALYSALPIGYDYVRQTGRHEYLPGVISGSTGGHLGFYYGDPSVVSPKTSGYAYTENTYEAAPTGRVMQIRNPGGAWRTASRFIDNAYSGTDDINPIGGNVRAPTPNSNPKFAYSASMAENYQVTRSFKDKLGRLVKSGVQVGASWSETINEYDGLGNNVKTIAPPGPGGSSLITSREFNSMGDMLSEHSPDLGKTLYIFDKKSRLRFTQTERQRPSRFNYIKYDLLDRVVEEGEMTESAYFNQWMADDPTFPTFEYEGRVPRTLNFYDGVPRDKNPCLADPSDLVYVIRSGAQPSLGREYMDWETAYTDVASMLLYRSSFTGKIKFYQVFDYPGQVIAPPVGSSYPPFPLNGQSNKVEYKLYGILPGDDTYNQVVGRAFPFSVQWGPLKGRLVQTVSCNSELGAESVGSLPISITFNYDKYGNVIDIYEYNGYIRDASKRWQKTSQKFDFQNRLAERKIFPDASASSAEVTFTYAYNSVGALDEVRDKNNVVVAKYTYNSIGQISGLDVGQGPGQVRMTYTYHFRGWIKKIEAYSASGARLFLQENKYEDGATRLYDGNISEYNYALTASVIDNFSFTYDSFSRLKTAVSTVKPAGQSGNSTWSYDYYDNGSLKTMTRQGQVFTYNYADAALPQGGTTKSNRVHSVTYSGSYERNTNPDNTFRYDGSGNRTEDNSRGMNIYYGSSNLPYKIAYTVPGNYHSQYMAYDAGGNRRSKFLYAYDGIFVSAVHYTSTGKEIREYYNQPQQEVYPLEGFGRVVKNTSGQQEYEAYLKNHLGSTMLVQNVNTNSLVYKTDYEPFGKLRLQTATTGVPLTEKFTGKEHDNGTELDYFGARYYDADLGIWISPDPAREFHSPFAYTTDPINYSDADGEKSNPIAWYWIDFMRKGKAIYTMKHAESAVESGHDIIAKNRQVRNGIARALGNGKAPEKDLKGHKGGRPHVHVAGRPKGWGHIFSAMTFFLLNRMDLEFLAKRAAFERTYGDFSIEFDEGGNEIWKTKDGKVFNPEIDLEFGEEGVTAPLEG